MRLAEKHSINPLYFYLLQLAVNPRRLWRSPLNLWMTIPGSSSAIFVLDRRIDGGDRFFQLNTVGRLK